MPPRQFVPTECPEEDCPSRRPGIRFEYVCAGTHHRKAKPHVVPRFECVSCGRGFCLMTYALTYWLKRPELVEPIAAGLVAGSSHRQIARSIGCAPSTVTRLAARLGRHAILLHHAMLEALARKPLEEAVVFDDFETFAHAQFFPFAAGTAVAEGSGLVLDIDQAPHARGGRLNPYERQRRQELYERFGPPPRGARRAAFLRILDRLRALAGRNDLVLVSDADPVYRRVVANHAERERILHLRFRNPERGPKGAPRTAAATARDQAMFEVDQLHRLLRHSQAAHRRETIAFGRRVGSLMERLFLFVVWRNLVKNRSERRPRHGTAAMQAGITPSRWTWRDVFRKRLFPWHAPSLPKAWRRIYRRRVRTPGTPPQAVHAPRFVH